MDLGGSLPVENVQQLASNDLKHIPQRYIRPNSLEGYGQAFVVSEDQKLDWGDMLFLLPLPVSQRNMRFWPNNPASFRFWFFPSFYLGQILI